MVELMLFLVLAVAAAMALAVIGLSLGRALARSRRIAADLDRIATAAEHRAGLSCWSG